MHTTTISFCDDDIQKYVVEIQKINRDLTIINATLSERYFTFVLMINLKNKFKNFVSRIITLDVLSSFDKISFDLAKLDRMNKRDTQIMTLRAQARDEKTLVRAMIERMKIRKRSVKNAIKKTITNLTVLSAILKRRRSSMKRKLHTERKRKRRIKRIKKRRSLRKRRSRRLRVKFSRYMRIFSTATEFLQKSHLMCKIT